MTPHVRTLLAMALCAAALLAFPVPSGAKPSLVLACPGQVVLGRPFMVRLTSRQPLAKVRVTWQGKSVNPPIGHWNRYSIAKALLGTDVIKVKPGRHILKLTAKVGDKNRVFKRTVRVVAKKYPVQSLSLPERMVTPPTETHKRISREYKEMRALLKTVTPAAVLPPLPMTRPVPGSVSSIYGLKRRLNGKDKSPHRGLDLRAAEGEPVLAAAPGRVALTADRYYAGNSVVLDHGLGVYTIYYHLSRSDVRPGQRVAEGEQVGLAGKTGRATGPHLHFSVSVLGQLVDPAPLFRKNTDNLLADQPLDGT